MKVQPFKTDDWFVNRMTALRQRRDARMERGEDDLFDNLVIIFVCQTSCLTTDFIIDICMELTPAEKRWAHIAHSLFLEGGLDPEEVL